jgi:hypothetical protein
MPMAAAETMGVPKRGLMRAKMGGCQAPKTSEAQIQGIDTQL